MGLRMKLLDPPVSGAGPARALGMSRGRMMVGATPRTPDYMRMYGRRAPLYHSPLGYHRLRRAVERRRATAWGLGATAVVLLAGCGILDFGRLPLTPGTRWQVTAVDEQAIANEDLLLAIEQDGEHATLHGTCSSALFQVVAESDGRALQFMMVPGRNDMGDGCAEDDLMHESLVAGALQTSERWDTDGDAVLVSGDQSVRLEPARESPRRGLRPRSRRDTAPCSGRGGFRLRMGLGKARRTRVQLHQRGGRRGAAHVHGRRGTH